MKDFLLETYSEFYLMFVVSEINWLVSIKLKYDFDKNTQNFINFINYVFDRKKRESSFHQFFVKDIYLGILLQK